MVLQGGVDGGGNVARQRQRRRRRRGSSECESGGRESRARVGERDLEVDRDRKVERGKRVLPFV